MLPRVLVSLALATVLAACEGDGKSDHKPPAGQGAIQILNNGSRDLEVFFDGVQQHSVDHGEDRAYDLAPGVYRVVLAEKDGTGTARDDVDVLQDRNTVLDVSNTGDPFSGELSVYTYFDTP